MVNLRPVHAHRVMDIAFVDRVDNLFMLCMILLLSCTYHIKEDGWIGIRYDVMKNYKEPHNSYYLAIATSSARFTLPHI